MRLIPHKSENRETQISKAKKQNDQVYTPTPSFQIPLELPGTTLYKVPTYSLQVIL